MEDRFAKKVSVFTLQTIMSNSLSTVRKISCLRGGRAVTLKEAGSYRKDQFGEIDPILDYNGWEATRVSFCVLSASCLLSKTPTEQLYGCVCPTNLYNGPYEYNYGDSFGYRCEHRKFFNPRVSVAQVIRQLFSHMPLRAGPYG